MITLISTVLRKLLAPLSVAMLLNTWTSHGASDGCNKGQLKQLQKLRDEVINDIKDTDREMKVEGYEKYEALDTAHCLLPILDETQRRCGKITFLEDLLECLNIKIDLCRKGSEKYHPDIVCLYERLLTAFCQAKADIQIQMRKGRKEALDKYFDSLRTMITDDSEGSMKALIEVSGIQKELQVCLAEKHKTYYEALIHDINGSIQNSKDQINDAGVAPSDRRYAKKRIQKLRQLRKPTYLQLRSDWVDTHLNSKVDDKKEKKILQQIFDKSLKRAREEHEANLEEWECRLPSRDELKTIGIQFE